MALVQRFAAVASAMGTNEDALDPKALSRTSDVSNMAHAGVEESAEAVGNDAKDGHADGKEITNDARISSPVDATETAGIVDAPNSHPSASDSAPPPPPMPSLPADMGDPQPDGEGGLIVSSTDEMPVVPHRQAFPTTENQAEQTPENETGALPDGAPPVSEAPNEPIISDQADPTTQAAGQDHDPVDPSELPANLLSEIGRLSREIVRNCEEKVALAVGAYNSVSTYSLEAP